MQTQAFGDGAAGRQGIDDAAAVPVRLRDMIDMMIGVTIFIAPWFNGDAFATDGSVRLRFIAMAVSGLSFWLLFHQRQAVAEWINAVLGALLVAAPLWRGGVSAQHVDSMIGGAVICVFSISCAIQLHRESARREAATGSRVRRDIFLN